MVELLNKFQTGTTTITTLEKVRATSLMEEVTCLTMETGLVSPRIFPIIYRCNAMIHVYVLAMAKGYQ